MILFNTIKDLLVFESDDDFYFLQILQRKKENPHLGSNSRVIKNYYIGNLEYLEDRYEEIKTLCDTFNARAMLRLNKRSYKKVAFKAMQKVANTMGNGEFSSVGKAYDRACGNGHNDKNKTWIVDIDGEYTGEWLEELIEYINSCQPEGDKIITQLPTKSGLHLITKPFNLKYFKSVYPDIDIHKDNPVNIYIPSDKLEPSTNRIKFNTHVVEQEDLKKSGITDEGLIPDDFELSEDEIRERIKCAKDIHVFSEREITFIVRKTWWDWNDKDLSLDVRRLFYPNLKQ